jgi:CRP-like cAMP-binding protein
MQSSQQPELDELCRLRPSSVFLRGLSEFDLSQLADSAVLKDYAPRTRLFRQGNKAENFFLLTRGVVKLCELSDGGDIATISIVSPGQNFGGQSLLRDSVYVLSAEAVEPSQALVWPGLAMRAFMDTIPGLTWNAYELTYQRLGEFIHRFRELATQNVEQRIAHTLMRLGQQIGRRHHQGIIIDGRFSAQDLAGYAGTTLFTISRVLNKWERLGIIRRSRASVILEKPGALDAIADPTLGNSH